MREEIFIIVLNKIDYSKRQLAGLDNRLFLKLLPLRLQVFFNTNKVCSIYFRVRSAYLKVCSDYLKVRSNLRIRLNT